MTGVRDSRASRPSKEHLLRGHGVSREVSIGRDNLDALGADTNYPVVTSVVDGASVSLGGLPAAHAVKGTNLLQGKTFAQYVFGTGNAAVTVKANRPGTAGNALAAKIVQGATLAAVESAGVLTITLATAGNTATEVAAAINASATAKLKFFAVAGGTGAGTVLIASQANLAGGLGEGLSIKVMGIEQQIVGFPTETSIPMVVSDLTGAGAADVAQLTVTSDGMCSDPVSLGVIA